MHRPSSARGVTNANIEENRSSEQYGVSDYRTIKPCVFAARVLLRPKRRAKISIGTLHVKVVEARGLMARDALGWRSDPYVKLDLSGRYLSTGQEWSEQFRIKQQTRIVKYRLNPVWNESFSLPVRRAGAFLRVEVWDWNFRMSDDPLGSFEVKIGEELLSQKAVDMWFVLDAPRDLKKSSSSSSDVEGNREAEQQQQLSEVEEQINEEREAAETLAGKRHRSKNTSRRRRIKRRMKNKVKDSRQHNHSAGEELETCEACIQRRRDQFGEVRLQLQFEFNEFGETCSHMWPEEPPQPVEMAEFSPNRLYYNTLLLLELVRPYVSFLTEAINVVYWVLPWTSLSWFIGVAVMLLYPSLLIVAINVSLTRSVIAAYRRNTSALTGEAPSARDAGGLARRSSWKRPKKMTISRLLPPIDEPGDEELQNMYQTVRLTKKLPVIVEELGKRYLAAEDFQWLVETTCMVLMIIRRLFHPVTARSAALTVVALACNSVLQLCLYLTSRFHLYLLGCCCGVFTYTFYAWRGRAFMAGVKEAVRCRQLCRSLSRTPHPFVGGYEEEVNHENTIIGGPAFAPPGASLAGGGYRLMGGTFRHAPRPA
eukprot:g9176.t1